MQHSQRRVPAHCCERTALEYDDKLKVQLSGKLNFDECPFASLAECHMKTEEKYPRTFHIVVRYTFVKHSIQLAEFCNVKKNVYMQW